MEEAIKSVPPGPAGTADPQPNSDSHRESLDAFRGVAILAVVFLHVSNLFLDREVPESGAWLAWVVPNRTAMFAVPAFLMLSALLNTRSMIRRNENARAYVLRRVLPTLWLYVLWSAVYLAFAAQSDPALPDTAWESVVFWGKAHYHLYFLSVLLQLLIALPLIVSWARRKGARASLVQVMLLAGACQLLVYAGNRFGYRLPYVGANILWYLPSVAAGIWLGLHWEQLEAHCAQALPVAGRVALVGYAAFLPVSVQGLLQRPVDTFLYQLSHWLFTGSFGLVLLAMCMRFPRKSPSSVWRLLAWCGAGSLPIYLLHPLVLQYLGTVPAVQRLEGSAAAFGAYVASCIVLPLVAHALTSRLGFSRILFANGPAGRKVAAQPTSTKTVNALTE